MDLPDDTAPTPLAGANRPSAWPASLLRPADAAPDAVTGAAFDVCRGALALRALLAVNGAVVLAVLAGAASWADALASFGPAIVIALSATLAWLALVCLLRGVLVRLPPTARTAALMILGAVLAPLACAPMIWLQLIELQPVRLVALALIGAVLALLLGLWLQWREGQRTPADARARLAELQSRIRPHFLFNTLNTAISLVRTDPPRAEAVLEDLAELFRVALVDGGSGAAVTLASEIELARRYLAIEQLRFGDRLRLDWQLDPATDAARLPALVLQPLLENAVRHGVEPAEGGGAVRVRTRARLGRAEIIIDNTVSGPSRPGHGVALANVRERLRLLHDLDAQFEVQRDDHRFRVRIAVPLGGEP
jgi:two-component system sensor histidine kinase AlgZ